ncbi:hypothetical protein CGZ93_08655 [Enemella dayhoffiae]|uniref:DUF3710 domain-containing protein n=1 Tax=Enemella dayhoffiae TaxID=2016507 RepID=A0A255H2K2_9ACTN|nr:DUF3710 domain-containing protein [Enemella dayhoffiae]OYO21988.1 hypothetical protein CGZ93_08655 [Enemella dayhoffiae]
MIFGRRKKQAEQVDEPTVDKIETTEEESSDENVDATASDPVDDDLERDASDAADSDEDDSDDTEGDQDEDADDDSEDDDSEDDEEDQDAEDEWAALDLSRDWREDGPFDIDEVDLDADEVQRLDLGALVLTPIPESELRLQVAEETQQIVSTLMLSGESALELSVFAAPRSPGLWTEIRQQIIEQTQAAGGTADCVEGPFGTELVRNVPVQTPDGQIAFQPSRTWVAQGPRWLLRGVLFGQAALSDQNDDELVGPFHDAFCDVVVRRGDAPMPVGDVLALTLPPELQVEDPAQG